MSIAPGTYSLGPQNGRLLIHTARSGAAAKAGHDLVIEVTSWTGALKLDPASGAGEASLTADSTSLRVREGHGGIQALDAGNKDNIRQTIDEEVLRGSAIEFRSTHVESPDGAGELRVSGELELAGATHPISFELTARDGRLSGGASVKQSDWGMKPYTTLFGALRVADEVRVTIDATLEA